MAWAVLLLVQGLIPVASVLLTRELVNALVTATGSDPGENAIRRAVLLAVAVALVLVVSELVRATTHWVRTAQGELVADHVHGLIHQRATGLDMAFFDSGDYFDRLHRARTEARTRPAQLVEGLGALVQGGLSLAAMAVVLATLAWWLPVALVVSVLPAFILILGTIERLHQWRIKRTVDQRRSQYFDILLTSREAFAEMRLFGLSDHFRKLFDGLRDRLRGERLQLARGEAKAQVGGGLFAVAILSASTLWMVWRAARGEVALGDLAMLFQAFLQGQRLLRSTLDNAGQVYSNMLFLGDLFGFLDQEPVITEPLHPTPLPNRLEQGIRFNDVTFHYPTNDRPVLDGFNLEIPAGATVALIGENGAGKTTLIKLLCRFYDPVSGSVEFDGTDVRAISLTDLRQRISVLFQEPIKYNLTAASNITLGDLAGAPPLHALQTAAENANAHRMITGLQHGYDTMLGAWFDGVELSHGQWQRLALSRAFLRDAEIVLLDEPTSAMDAWAAAAWMDRFCALVEDRTAVLITHRLTTAKRADFIHLVNSGRIVESGTHEELLALNRAYASAWQKQGHYSE